MIVLVTGCAGFIGFHVANRLLAEHIQVVGIDNLNEYYDVKLKQDRLQQLAKHKHFRFAQIDIADRAALAQIFNDNPFDYVIHLAAQAGVRYSIANPYIYADSNLVGFVNMLEACRQSKIKHFIFASSSSVYGANTHQPFSEHASVDHPISLYGATKKANEALAHSYAHLYGLPCTGLRFFTVYGPWGRPDMALFKFTQHILEGKAIDVYNHGEMQRDFTYIDDIVESIYRLLQMAPEPDSNWDSGKPDPATSNAPYTVFNIGNNQPVALEDFISALEQALGKQAQRHYMPLQPGDVPATYADSSRLIAAINFQPNTLVTIGIKCFVEWYLEYYKVHDLLVSNS